MKYHHLLVATMLSSVACPLLGAQAQTPPPPATAGSDAPDPVESRDGNGLEDIIVTAQRRSESAQRAAVAISVLQPAALAAVTDPAQLTTLAPAVQFGTAGGSSPIYYVRGVGTFSSNAYTDSAVAVNYDGVYIGRPTSTNGLFYDLDRIEILKGPQGTLYGRNATGGAINILPARPQIGRNSMSATVSTGNYDAINAQASANMSLSDNAALRVAGIAYAHDGYNSDGTYTEKGTGGRSQLLLEPLATMSIRVGGDYFHLGGTGSTGVLAATDNALTGGTTVLELGRDVGIYDPRSVVLLNSSFVGTAGATYGALPARPYIDNISYGLNAEMNATLGFADLAVIAAWRRAKINQVGQPASFVTQLNETDEQTSLEARLSGKAGLVDWLVGGYYFDEDIVSSYALNTNFLATVQNLTAGNRSYAGFGRLTFNLSDRLRLTGAARYTRDRKRFDGVSDSANAICTSPTHICPDARRLPADIRNLTAALAGIGYVQPPGSPVYIDVAGASGLIWVPGRTVVNDSTSTEKLTFRAAAEFEPREATLLYASFERGYRAGGFSFATLNPTYAPETLDAYTIGAKNRFFDKRLQLNVEGFIWKYKDQQLVHQAIGPSGGIELVTENIGRSTNKGVEVELVAKPIANTVLYADVQYLDAKNDDFVFSDADTSLLAQLPAGTLPPDTRCPSTLQASGTYRVDCSGMRALRSPQWTINLGIEQTVPLSASLDLVLEGNTHYQSSSIVMFERRAQSVQPAYWLSGASVTLAGADRRWSISAFVSNIENKRIVNNAFYLSLSGVTTVNVGPPRLFGARLHIGF